MRNLISSVPDQLNSYGFSIGYGKDFVKFTVQFVEFSTVSEWSVCRFRLSKVGFGFSRVGTTI